MVQDGRWTIAIGCDNNGLEHKNQIKADFEADPRVAGVIDLGIRSGDDATAYPHIAVDVATAVKEGKANRGLLICGTGLGVAIAANKVSGIRAVTAHDTYSVERGVLSNDAQILCMGQKVIEVDLARKLAGEWLGYEFDHQSASAAKVKVINEYEEKNL
jgi:ribose 5-phosphate isomerase B